MTEVLGIKVPLQPWVVLPVLLLATVTVAYAINLLVLWLTRRLLGRQSEEFESRFYRLLERYLLPLLILIAFFALEDAVRLHPSIAGAIHHLLIALALLLGTFLLTRVALLLLRSAAARYEAMENIIGPAELATKILFFVVGGTIILANIGISVTPILTTLGVGSLAVAIALQDTLGNFFAGLYIKADRPLEVGHFIRLENGEEGYVHDIGWRNTRIRKPADGMVIVPNTKLVQSIITNYNLPERDTSVLVEVGVDSASDLEKVDEVAREVALAVSRSVSGEASPGPVVRYQTFAGASVKLSVALKGRRGTDHFLLRHELIKQLSARLRSEGVTIR